MKQIITLLMFIAVFSAMSNATIYYVSSDATDDSGAGTTWATAKKTIAAAYALAGLSSNVDDIYVKGGTYDLDASLVINKAVNLYGGFTGLSESETPATRVLSDLDGNGRVDPWEFSNASVLSSTFKNPNSTLAASAFTFSTATATESVNFNGFTITHTVSTTNGAQRTFDCLSSLSVVENVTFVNSNINTLQYSSVSNRATLLSAKGIIRNCLFEKNTVYVRNSRYDKYVMPIVSLEAATKFTGCVLRNNKATIDYTNCQDATATFVLGLILHSAGGASVSNPTTIANCLIYNNEGIYIPKTTGGVAIPSYSGIVTVDAIGTAGSDSIVNCVIARNKATSLQTAGLLVRRATTQNHFVFNNVMWLNKMADGTMSNFYHNGGTSTTSIIKGNVMNQGGFFPADDGVYFSDNLTDLGNTDKLPNFKVQTTVNGNAADGTVELANWAISYPSYLSGKGLSTTILKDYSGNNYAASPAVGANELITHYRTKASGNWDGSAVWEWSNDKEIWTATSEVPADQFQSVSIDSGHEIVVAANATSPALSVNSGGQLTVNSGSTLGVTGDFIINSDGTNGTGTLVDKNADGGISISGTKTVEQYLTSSQTGVNGRNWYISSPLTAASSSTITTATGNGLVYYDGTTNWPAAGATMDIMKGYIGKSPAQNTTISFTGGDLNTGSQAVNNLPVGFNLVGNPYPSYVDFSQATRTAVENSIWYRSKRTGAYVFQTYNVPSNIGANDGTAIIPPMQSFWIKTTSSSNTLGFSNAMRSHQDQSVVANRLKAPKVSTQQLLRLQVSNAVNADETVIYFNPNALNAVDEYDSQKMFNNIDDVPEIFTKNGSTNLVINGMNEISFNTEIPLGFTSGTAGNFKFKAIELVKFDSNIRVYLRDKEEPTDFELTLTTEYIFNSAIATANESRFSLLFKAPSITTGNVAPENEHVSVFVNTQNKIVINANAGSKYAIYNAVGQQIAVGKTNSNIQTSNFKLKSGIYVVRVGNVTERVIIK